MKTIQELIDFCESIPEEQWTGGAFERNVNGVTKRCVTGHLNYHLSGSANPPVGWHTDLELEPCFTILKDLKIVRADLVTINNHAAHHERNHERSVKKHVISYLTSKQDATRTNQCALKSST